VLDYFQGGGKTMNVMMVKLAERKLQQRDTELALAISGDAAKKSQDDVQARMVNAYALLKAGRLAEAEKAFGAMARGKGKAEVIGKEGLAAVYLRQGKNDKALAMARDAQKLSPDRPYAHVVIADVLYGQNKKKEAQGEYEAATKKSGGESFQKAQAYNKLGRLYASVKDYKKSRELYDNAVTLDPYYVEAMSNKGVTYEREGKWEQALQTYQAGQGAAGGDQFSKTLAARAADMVAYQKDAARKERVDKLVHELAERFRSQGKGVFSKEGDTWTSPPMVVSFVDFQETGMLGERDGIATVLASQLSEGLKASGRVKVVERVILDRLLEELNLGSSQLADPETSLKLGRVLAARVIGTGTLYNLPESTLLNMRLVNTETTVVDKVITLQMAPGTPSPQDVFQLTRQVLTSVIREHPLQAYVAEIKDSQAVINIGTDQGVVSGTRFEVIEPGREMEYKGKKLASSPAVVGMMEVVKTEPGFAFCRILDQKRAVAKDDKVVEKPVETQE
jgi:tetratricopeptide (TPR) repeat protein